MNIIISSHKNKFGLEIIAHLLINLGITLHLITLLSAKVLSVMMTNISIKIFEVKLKRHFSRKKKKKKKSLKNTPNEGEYFRN